MIGCLLVTEKVKSVLLGPIVPFSRSPVSWRNCFLETQVPNSMKLDVSIEHIFGGYCQFAHCLQISVLGGWPLWIKSTDSFVLWLFCPTGMCWTVRKGHCTVQTDVKLIMCLRISSNLLFSCLGLRSAVITGMCHHNHLSCVIPFDHHRNSARSYRKGVSKPSLSGWLVFPQKVMASFRVPLCTDLLPVSGNCSSLCLSSQRLV